MYRHGIRLIHQIQQRMVAERHKLSHMEGEQVRAGIPWREEMRAFTLESNFWYVLSHVWGSALALRFPRKSGHCDEVAMKLSSTIVKGTYSN